MFHTLFTAKQINIPNKAQAAREPANSTTLFTNETITPKVLTDIPTNELEQIFLKQDGESKFYARDFERLKIANIITKYDEII